MPDVEICREHGEYSREEGAIPAGKNNCVWRRTRLGLSHINHKFIRNNTIVCMRAKEGAGHTVASVMVGEPTICIHSAIGTHVAILAPALNR